ncbi:hypothetical protein BOTBODRAFT_183858 [Botryobasidium botryosum FD-172 SS1]|uniref:Uncharacterized protein n=1 Tax=Botryobasidium botryosum (strain FD-172 SS1) TaxID=930990 RepID=A0A067MVT9_BOTB1|nr:hypothetical protein BOTBODRAFT_183858 [Botryobasidium botryosum FD-172 SS1]
MSLEGILRDYDAAWLSNLHYHQANLVLLIQEVDGLDNSYTSLLIKDIIRSREIEMGDWRQGQSTLITRSFRRRKQTPPRASNAVQPGMYCIDYEAQFYAELRAFHDAKYAWILLQEAFLCLSTTRWMLDALLDELCNVGPTPPPQVPARPKLDNVERVFDTHIYADAPRMAALINAMDPGSWKVMQKKMETFREMRHYFPAFLMEHKHGDWIPHFRPELTKFM